MDNPTPRIDAHQHFWRRARGDYGWLRPNVPALQPLVRDFEPQDLAPLLQRHGVAQTVLVQAAPTVAETEHMLALAAATPWIGGVVGWVELGDPASTSELRRLARDPAFKGVRPMLQDLDDVEWIVRGPAPAALAAVADLDLAFDALVKTPHLPALLRFVARHPELRVVVDHGAKPVPAGHPERTAWRDGIARLAEHPQVHCKLSGLLTEVGAEGAPAVWEHLLACFGAERLIWGSDWPVSILGGGYDRWVDVCEALIGTLPLAYQHRVWAANAARFYRLT